MLKVEGEKPILFFNSGAEDREAYLLIKSSGVSCEFRAPSMDVLTPLLLVGYKKFLWVYFGGGIVGNILFLLLGDSYSIAVGASGAVYAVAGVLVVMMPNLRVYLYFILPMPLWIVVLIFFVLWSFIPGLNIAWQAHIGGLLVGLIAGYFFRKSGRYYYYR